MKRYMAITFIIMGGLLAGCLSRLGYYNRDGQIVFQLYTGGDESIVVGADPGSFKRFDESFHYGKDQNAVYYFGKRIEGADPESFRMVSLQYWMDAYSVYYNGDKIPGADPESFRHLGGAWAKDANTAYHKAQAIAVADVATFESIPADGLSYLPDFKYGYARDSGAYYSYDETLVRVDCDYDSMEILKYGYAKDANRVFFFGHAVVGADPNTFKVPKDSYSKDRGYDAYDHHYYYERGIKKSERQ